MKTSIDVMFRQMNAMKLSKQIVETLVVAMVKYFNHLEKGAVPGVNVVVTIDIKK